MTGEVVVCALEAPPRHTHGLIAALAWIEPTSTWERVV